MVAPTSTSGSALCGKGLFRTRYAIAGVLAITAVVYYHYSCVQEDHRGDYSKTGNKNTSRSAPNTSSSHNDQGEKLSFTSPLSHPPFEVIPVHGCAEIHPNTTVTTLSNAKYQATSQSQFQCDADVAVSSTSDQDSTSNRIQRTPEESEKIVVMRRSSSDIGTCKAIQRITPNITFIADRFDTDDNEEAGYNGGVSPTSVPPAFVAETDAVIAFWQKEELECDDADTINIINHPLSIDVSSLVLEKCGSFSTSNYLVNVDNQSTTSVDVATRTNLYHNSSLSPRISTSMKLPSLQANCDGPTSMMSDPSIIDVRSWVEMSEDSVSSGEMEGCLVTLPRGVSLSGLPPRSLANRK